MYLNTVFGDEFWVNEPERYPKGYYGFSSKVRIHVDVYKRQVFQYTYNIARYAIAVAHLPAYRFIFPMHHFQKCFIGATGALPRSALSLCGA